MTNVVVIGSNSFSGSDFVDLLLEQGGYRVHGISRSPEKGPLFLPYLARPDAPFTFHKLDLNRNMEHIQELLLQVRPAFVVNFASQSEVGPSWDSPWDWFQTNAVALTRLIHFLNGQPWLQRYVHISSPEVYGTCVGTVREEAPLNPSTPYAASKAAGDLSIFTFHRQFGFPAAMVRATNVYGARQQLFKIIPRAFIRVRRGEVLELHGGGQAVKSYIHIRDVSRGELAVMERGRPGQIYHFSPDAGISVREVVERICRLCGVQFGRAVRTVAERPGQDAAYVIDSSKARSEFGWAPRIGFEEGLTGVRDWIEANWEAIQRESHVYEHKA